MAATERECNAFLVAILFDVDLGARVENEVSHRLEAVTAPLD